MFKYCIVPSCPNSAYKMPRKLFISVPKNPEVRTKWCRAIKRQSALFSPKSTLFVCEDHFNLREDLENYVRFSLMGGKLQIKKNVVPHIFSEIKTYTSQIDQKIVDIYNKPLSKFSDRKQCKPSISVVKSPKDRRLEPETGEIINNYDSKIEIKEHIQDNITIKEELENSSSSVVEHCYVFIKTECGDNNDKTESIIKGTDSGSNINDFSNMFIKSECEDINEQTQSKMEEIGIEWNTNDSSNVSIKPHCENTNDNTKRNLEDADAEFKINNFTNVLIKTECEETDEQIQSNVEEIDTEYNEMDSTNMSFKTEYKNDNNECILLDPDGNIVCIKMERNIDDPFVERLPENKNEYQALPYSNRNIIIVTNGFDTTADEKIIENNILIEETNNIITYNQNELVSINDNILCEENTVYKVCRNGEIQNKSSLCNNNKMIKDHWLADCFVTCMVPQCSKTKKYNPKTRFFKSPKDIRWETWLMAIYFNPDILEHKTTYYICEDHFDLPNDVENWENYQKNREHPKMRQHVLPSPAVVQSEMDEGEYRRKKLHRHSVNILK